MDGAPAIVLDNGTGYTKMGYAGNVEPQCVLLRAAPLSRRPRLGLC